MDWKTSFFAFLCILAGTCVIPFISMEDDGVVEKPSAPIVIQTNACDYASSTNSITVTNALERAGKPNTGWFIDSSNYIWDGWKIK